MYAQQRLLLLATMPGWSVQQALEGCSFSILGVSVTSLLRFAKCCRERERERQIESGWGWALDRMFSRSLLPLQLARTITGRRFRALLFDDV